MCSMQIQKHLMTQSDEIWNPEATPEQNGSKSDIANKNNAGEQSGDKSVVQPPSATSVEEIYLWDGS